MWDGGLTTGLRGLLLLVVISVGVTLDGSTIHGFFGVLDYMRSHQTFYTSQAHLFNDLNSGVWQRSLERQFFAPTSTAAWCSTRSGSLRSVARLALMVHLVQSLLVVNPSGCLGSDREKRDIMKWQVPL